MASNLFNNDATGILTLQLYSITGRNGIRNLLLSFQQG
jgi:hypothetical protein